MDAHADASTSTTPAAMPPPPPEPRRPLLAVAPMIDVTDRHFRMLIRCVSPLPTLWTEMTWDRAILYNAPSEPEYALNKNEPRKSVESLIGFSAEERPLVMQLGGAEPERLARAAAHAARRGYDEVNLNCGCPAQTRGRARNCYGARLMFEPQRVADCCAAMIAAVGGRCPVTVKCRLGVDDRDTYEQLHEFVRVVAAVGVTHFIVHARKAILGLDTVKNRSVPPLRHEWVLRLIDDFPALKFTLNGGVTSLAAAAELLARGVHGVMIGRRSSADPYMFAAAASVYGRGEAGPSRREVLERYMEYATRAQAANWEEEDRPEAITRKLLTPLHGLFANVNSNAKWRRQLCAAMQDRARLASEPVAEIIRACLATSGLTADVLDARPSLPAPKPPPATVEAAAAAAEARPDGTSPTSVTASTRARESPVTHTPQAAPALAWLASVQSLLGCGACVR